MNARGSVLLSRFRGRVGDTRSLKRADHPRVLELVAERELHDPGRTNHVADLAEAGRHRDIYVRIREVYVVQEIVGLGAELDDVPLGDSELFHQRQVYIKIPRPAERVASRVADAAGQRVAELCISALVR